MKTALYDFSNGEPTHIANLKALFLDKFNNQRDVDKAARNSIRAAVQHNLLYKKEVTLLDKKMIRESWARLLYAQGHEFKEKKTIADHEEAVLFIKEKLNSDFSIFFWGSGLRISHAQKSFSLFLKYMWCLNQIPEPVTCPIDRQILMKTDASKTGDPNDIAWGYVNDMDEHRKKRKFIEDAAKLQDMSVAEWELSNFGRAN